MFYFTGGSTGLTGAAVHIDNVKVTKKGATDTVVFECDYTDARIGQDAWAFPKSSGDAYPVEDPLSGVKMLPIPVHDSGIFVAWYTDAALQNPVTENSFKKGQVLTLYAKWRFYDDKVSINVDDNDAYWHIGGKREDNTRMDIPLTITTDGANKVIKYKMGFAMNQEATAYDNSLCETGGFDNWGFGLFDPSIYANDPTAKREDAAYLVKEGNTYFVSFKYKALSVDNLSTTSTRLKFNLAVSNENNTRSAMKILGAFTGYSHTPDADWKTAHITIKIPSLEGAGNRLAITCLGFGEVLIDDITIINVKNGLAFDTNGGSAVEPIYGNVGDAYATPANPTRENSVFVGWYADKEFTKAYTPSATIAKGAQIVYAKFLTYQTVQGFEDFEKGKSEAFQHYFWLNKPCKDTDFAANKNWLGSKYVKDGIRTGISSVYSAGSAQDPSQFIVFDANSNPLTEGETYTISFWIKLEEYFLPGNINLLFTTNIDDITSEDGWSVSRRGERAEYMLSTRDLEDYVGQWVEMRYEFVAKAKYCGIQVPGITTCYIDDVVFTHKDAPESYARSIAGEGVTYEEFSKVTMKAPAEEEVVEATKITIDPIYELETGFALWVWFAIIGGAVVLVAAITVLVIVLIKKKRAN